MGDGHKWDDEFEDYVYDSDENKWIPPEPEGEIVFHSPPLVDYRSAYQNGLLDAVNGRVPMDALLNTAEEPVLLKHYCQGFEFAAKLMRLQEKEND